MFPEVRAGVASVLDPAKIRWVSFSHFESNECGSLNEWLAIAPQAEAVTGVVGSLVNLNDFAARPPKTLTPRRAADGKIPVPLSSDAAFAARLGCRRDVRRDIADAAVLRPFPPGR
jgi:hypothetical protein